MTRKIRRPTSTLLCALTLVALFTQLTPVNAAENFDALVAGIEAANSGAGRAITLEADIRLRATLPPVTGEISIDGGGHTISGNDAYRIFDVNGGTLSIKNLTLTGGNAGEGEGGAIRLRNGARAAIESSAFNGNKATHGGAISVAGSGARLSVSSSSYVGNHASASGGAIGAPVTGGGGSVSISSSSFVQNSAERGDGGAITAVSHKIEINNSTFSENYAYWDGGALKIDESSVVTTSHSTFVDNRSRLNLAKAISNARGKAYLRNSIIVSSGGSEDCIGVWDQSRGNLSPDGSCAERPSDDPRLGELTGSPAYYPLLDRSPAVDNADPEFCLEADQIGTARPQGGGCDIGAIESTTAIAAEPTPVPPVVCTLAYQIIAANNDWPAGGCPAGSGVDIISLDKDITLFEVLPSITSHIIIEGNGHSISGDGNFRIFDVVGGFLTVKNLTMTEGYSAFDDGGAIRLQNGGRAAVSDSRFINNTADNGGAVFIGWAGTDNSWVTVKNSSFVNNHSRIDGGAIYAGGGSVSISNSSFVGTTGQFGAVHALNFIRLDVTNSSFINNRSPAMFFENGVAAYITHVTITGSSIRMPQESKLSANRLYLRNSIVNGSLDSTVCDQITQNIANLIADGSCSSKLSDDPMLAEATGAAAYLELLPGSPAINAADARFCLDTDQLGRPRAIVGACDIGAVEAIPVSQALSNCAVTTTHVLNLRDGPSGNVIGGVPQNATLSVVARTPRWFEVEHEDRSGWISADYVLREGDCE